MLKVPWQVFWAMPDRPAALRSSYRIGHSLPMEVTVDLVRSTVSFSLITLSVLLLPILTAPVIFAAIFPGLDGRHFLAVPSIRVPAKHRSARAPPNGNGLRKAQVRSPHALLIPRILRECT